MALSDIVPYAVASFMQSLVEAILSLFACSDAREECFIFNRSVYSFRMSFFRRESVRRQCTEACSCCRKESDPLAVET